MFCKHCGKPMGLNPKSKLIADGYDSKTGGRTFCRDGDEYRCPDPKCRRYGKLATMFWLILCFTALPCEIPAPFMLALYLIIGSGSVNYIALAIYSLLFVIGLTGGLYFNIAYHRLSNKPRGSGNRIAGAMK